MMIAFASGNEFCIHNSTMRPMKLDYPTIKAVTEIIYGSMESN